MTHRPRKRFQIHLSTAIVMMFVAGGLIWANTHAGFVKKTVSNIRLVELSDEDAYRIGRNWSQGIQLGERGNYYGWPMYPMCSKHGYEMTEINEKIVQVNNPSDLYAGAIAVNALTAIGIHFTVWFLCEWLIRRRAMRKGA